MQHKKIPQSGNICRLASCCKSCFLPLNKFIFAGYQPGYRSDFNRKGKSGQHRATHRLRAGFDMFSGDTNHSERDRATENYRPDEDRDKGENVR